MFSFWWNITIFTQIVIPMDTFATFSKMPIERQETIRGVAKSEGVFRDAARKVVKRHKIHFFRENHVKKVKNSWKSHFASRKTQNPQNARNPMNSLSKLVEIPPESPKITLWAQNTLFHPKVTLARKVRFGAKRRLWIAFSHFSGPGAQNTNPGYFKF